MPVSTTRPIAHILSIVRDRGVNKCPPDASAFQRYTATFASPLSRSQCEALDTLLPAGAPHAGAVASESLA